MDTSYGKGDTLTLLTPADRRILGGIVRLFGGLLEDGVEPLGQYRTMTQDKAWQLLVGQICVMGSARHLESIRSDPAKRPKFEIAVSLESLKRQRNPVSYLSKNFARFRRDTFSKARR